MSKLALSILAAALALAAIGCMPPHYSVAAAISHGHVTYAQRHHQASRNDYLVDCRVDDQGNRSDCRIIELVGEEQ